MNLFPFFWTSYHQKIPPGAVKAVTVFVFRLLLTCRSSVDGFFFLDSSCWNSSRLLKLTFVSFLGFQSIDIYIKKDARKGVVNNRQTDWSFRLDGVLHNASQELAYETVAQKLVSDALVGYNGNFVLFLLFLQ